MAFDGWPAEALEFYEGLEADNSRTYWTRHKALYDEKVLGPMTELVADLAPEFGDAKIFRPYRDVRFSKDKSPYKTNIGALVGSGYIQLSARGLAAGDGMYHLAEDRGRPAAVHLSTRRTAGSEPDGRGQRAGGGAAGVDREVDRRGHVQVSGQQAANLGDRTLAA